MAFDKEIFKKNLKDGLSIAKEKIDYAADIAKEKAKDGSEKANVILQEGREKLSDAKEEMDKMLYNPISLDMFVNDQVEFPKLIRLLDRNPYSTKEVCREAIGFNSIIAKNKVLELIKGEFPGGKINFVPNLSNMIYLKNPYEKDMYIALDAYFSYVKKARVAELIDIANCLGAKFVKIVYKEETKKFINMEYGDNDSESAEKIKIAGKNRAKVEANSLRELEVAAESTFPGHNNPVRPKLTYFKGDIDVEQFINHQFGPNPTNAKSFMIKYHQGNDLSIDAAAGIDAVLGKLKIKASASVKSEVESENRLYLYYEIKF